MLARGSSRPKSLVTSGVSAPAVSLSCLVTEREGDRVKERGRPGHRERGEKETGLQTLIVGTMSEVESAQAKREVNAPITPAAHRAHHATQVAPSCAVYVLLCRAVLCWCRAVLLPPASRTPLPWGIGGCTILWADLVRRQS